MAGEAGADDVAGAGVGSAAVDGAVDRRSRRTADGAAGVAGAEGAMGETEAAAEGGVSASSACTASIIGSAAVPNGKCARSIPCASTRKMSAVCAIA